MKRISVSPTPSIPNSLFFGSGCAHPPFLDPTNKRAYMLAYPSSIIIVAYLNQKGGYF